MSFLRALPILPLAACVAATDAAPLRSVTDTVSISVDGIAFTALRQPGVPGVELTGAGARSVAGDTILVSRSPALAMHEGAVAKKAARIGCLETGGRFNEVAIGGYEAGSWVFAGGCA